MNRVCLVGRLIAKPELRYTSNNIAVTRFSVAVNRTFSNADGEREADFINVIVWRKQAENVANYLDKGSRVSIEGRIQTGSYTDKDGINRYTTDVVADSVQFLDTKKQTEARANNSTPYDYQDAPANNVNDDPFADFGEQVSIDDNYLD
ncbi:single-stranded DNA-binding protein [uncultured Thomasclavelia sp.]|uniref:single-stranded DNA-binding protein n=1 Tax=uncultured Thomasclavelia sp. TaxID=3025759 RepID=UPI002594D787|nr:single-stranded DNA-binding protein [uncultured Thomasclavelia sp.]